MEQAQELMDAFLASFIGESAVFSPEESWHCAKVLRKQAGEEIRVIDGQGYYGLARLTSVNEKKCEATFVEGPLKQAARDYYLHLAIAPTKQIDRTEWLIEKAVEIGVDEVSFIECRNSERKKVNIERIGNIALSAVKQSLQARMPLIHDLQRLGEFVRGQNADRKYIAHCSGNEKRELKELKFAKDEKAIALIGPEGDFTPEEIKEAANAGYQPVGLGPNRLRTETAGLYICQAHAILT
jgi:16S rRNA (uracil1498-N3)-methyltransferase